MYVAFNSKNNKRFKVKATTSYRAHSTN